MTAAITSNQPIYQGKGKQPKKILDYANEYYYMFYALFVNIKILIDAKCLNNDVINKIILNNEKYILFNIVEPMMKHSPEYDSTLFDEYRKIFQL
jgi:hypothetical protein